MSYLTYLGATAPLPPGATGPGRPPGGTTVSMAATPETGKLIYESQACSACHAIRGQGGAAGPDLTRVGRTRDAAWLARFILCQAAVNPRAGGLFINLTPSIPLSLRKEEGEICQRFFLYPRINSGV